MPSSGETQMPRRGGVVTPVLIFASNPWKLLSGFGILGLQFHHGGTMGREVVRVPPGFGPASSSIRWMKRETTSRVVTMSYFTTQILHRVRLFRSMRTSVRAVSPVFDTAEALAQWLGQEGWQQEAIDSLLEAGHIPSFVVRSRLPLLTVLDPVRSRSGHVGLIHPSAQQFPDRHLFRCPSNAPCFPAL